MSSEKKKPNSDDYNKLMQLMHNDGYNLLKVGLRLDQVENKPGSFTEKSAFTLEKGKETITIESTESDLGSLVWHLKTFPNLDFENEFKKVDNLEKYFSEIQFLTDENGKKLQRASEEVVKGNFKFDSDFEEMIDCFLNEKNNKGRSNKKYLKLKHDYYYILLYHLDLLQKTKGLLDRYSQEKSNFKSYNDALFKRLMKYLHHDKPVEMYRRLIKILDFDPSDRLSIYAVIKQDNNELFAMMQSHYGSSANAVKMIPRLLDMYRRFAEFSGDYVQFFSKIEHELCGEAVDANWGFTEHYQYLDSKKTYSSMLKSLDPQIRHSESHLNTRTGERIGKILITKKNGRKRKVLKEYSYQEFSEMLKDLDNGLALAFTISVISAYIIVLHSVLISLEYKVLLLGIDNQK